MSRYHWFLAKNKIMELHTLSIREAHELLSSKQISSVELTAAVLEHIHKTDPYINTFVTIADDLALEQAHLADERLSQGDRYYTADRHPVRGQGLHLHPGSPHHLFVQNPGELHSAVQRHGHRPAFNCRRSSDGQTQHGRVRHGFFL